MRTSRRTLTAIAVTVFCGPMFANAAQARTIRCADGDVACLIVAINGANADGRGEHTIQLTGTYALTDVDNGVDGANGLPSITGRVKIEGGGQTTITRAANSSGFRLFHVAATGQLTLEGLTLSHGNGAGAGGAVFSDGVVTIKDCVFSSNSSSAGGGAVFSTGVATIARSTFTSNSTGIGDGGGLLNHGKMVITDSAFDGNTSAKGAGGIANSTGDMRLARSRVTNNLGGFGAGGLAIYGGNVTVAHTTFAGNGGDANGGVGIYDTATVVVKKSAFVENRSMGFQPGTGGAALFNLSGTVTVTNTTFARNVARTNQGLAANIVDNRGTLTLTNVTFGGNSVQADSSGNVATARLLFDGNGGVTQLQNTILAHAAGESSIEDCGGLVTSLGHNVIGDFTACNLAMQSGDLTGNPGLDGFADDGTPGNGHFPLLGGSEAINAADGDVCTKRDQIGQPRRGRCDIGAIEFQDKKNTHR